MKAFLGVKNRNAIINIALLDLMSPYRPTEERTRILPMSHLLRWGGVL